MSDSTIEQDRIEQDLEQTRARMDDRLSELEKRLSPGQILDDLLAYFRGQEGAYFGRNLMQSVQNNPLPSALTGIGLTWLMASSQQSAAGHNGARPVGTLETTSLRGKWKSQEELDRALRTAEGGVVRQPDETESSYCARIDRARAELLGVNRLTADTDEAFSTRVEDALSAAKRSITELGEDLGERAMHATQQLGETVSEKVSAGLAEGKETAQKLGSEAQKLGSEMLSTLTANPVMLGALGLAMGAMLGALIPQTEQEEAAFGAIARDVRDTAHDLGEKALDQGAQTVQAALDPDQGAAKEDASARK